jgi:hypothetical protein
LTDDEEIIFLTHYFFWLVIVPLIAGLVSITCPPLIFYVSSMFTLEVLTI